MTIPTKQALSASITLDVSLIPYEQDPLRPKTTVTIAGEYMKQLLEGCAPELRLNYIGVENVEVVKPPRDMNVVLHHLKDNNYLTAAAVFSDVYGVSMPRAVAAVKAIKPIES